MFQWDDDYRIKKLCKDAHAFLSPSKCSWLNYDEGKMLEVFNNFEASKRGTELHAWAANTIRLGIKQQNSKKTICAYVNDAIRYGMETERLLYFSPYCFGTADAIVWNEKQKILRIHDLKTGMTPAHMEQLVIYAALFCLQYKDQIPPLGAFGIELRIYQMDNIIIHQPTPEEISMVMAKIVGATKLLDSYRNR